MPSRFTNPLSGDPISPPSLARNSYLLEHRLSDLRVLGMHGEDTVLELPRHTNRVNEEPLEMRGIEFQIPNACSRLARKRPASLPECSQN